MKPGTLEDLYKLTPLQEEMLLATTRAPNSGVYVVQSSCVLTGDLDAEAFSGAWQQVVDRHPILRTSFHWKDLEKPLQAVHRDVRLPLSREDWRGLSAAEQQDRFERLLQDDRRAGFQPDRVPLMRLRLIQLNGGPDTKDETAYRLLWTLHHLLVDGWTFGILMKEVFLFYEAVRRGITAELHTPPPFRDYISWLRAQDIAAAEAFWRRRLAGLQRPPLLDASSPPRVPASDPAAQPVPRHCEFRSRVPRSLTADLHGFAREHQLTLNTLVQGAWALLLSRYTGRADVVYGTIVSGRPASLSGVESMVGPFINLVPVRAVLSGEDRLLPWLDALQAEQAEAREYEHTSLARIQSWSDLPGGQPLFDTLFVFENYPVDTTLLQIPNDGIRVHDVRVAEQWRYPLHVIAGPGEEMQLDVLYDANRFETGTVDGMVEHLRDTLRTIVADPSQRVADLVTPSE